MSVRSGGKANKIKDDEGNRQERKKTEEHLHDYYK